MNDFLVKIKSYLKNGKTLLIVGLIGILLVGLSSVLTPSQEKNNTDKGNVFDAENYRQELEKNVKKIVSSITGSRDITVLLTLEGGKKYSYGFNNKSSTTEKSTQNGTDKVSDQETDYIIITDSSGNEQAVPVYEYYPEVRGVSIVYSAPSVKGTEEKIKNAVMAALDITSKRINIVNKGGN
ncbi:MAG: hypothetical protein IJP26_03260 [Clostridia bacterium]|nr:hypothetical protein [Clostridia bacterium]